MINKSNNILFSEGRSLSFLDAMLHVISASRYEERHSESAEEKALWESEIKKAQKAAQIYDRVVGEAKKFAVEKMKEEGINEIAEAFEIDDYTSLSF